MPIGRWLSSQQRDEIRRRYAAGERAPSIASSLGLSQFTIYDVVRQRSARPPRPIVQSPLRLSLAEREEISRGLHGGDALRVIARRLHRAPSTVCREVAANGGRDSYRAVRAERAARRRAKRPKPAKLATNLALRLVVEALLELRLSPHQIAARLRRDHPTEPEMWVSAETIYQSLFVQGRGALRAELAVYLRSGRAHRRSQQRHAGPRSQVRNMVL